MLRGLRTATRLSTAQYTRATSNRTTRHYTPGTTRTHVELEQYKIDCSEKHVLRNASVPTLYEHAIAYEKGSFIASSGALIASSGKHTGRTPSDKRVVDTENVKDIWWGKVNIKLDEHTFKINKERAIDYLNIVPRLFVFDGYAGWDPEHRLKVRVITTRAYHALFMHNMLIRPTEKQLEDFGDPDWTIFNAGNFPANKYTKGMTSAASVDINFQTKEFVILGTQYAGEMKKGVFTVMNWLMPTKGILSMHGSCNESKTDPNNVTIFFGLSGTGKTTLSADNNRFLIGDDEHCWTDNGIFNVEGGCYAKAIGLKRELEPEIYDAIKFGAVLENVVYDEHSRNVNYDSESITQNTRVSYPLEHIENAKMPAMCGHPSNVIMLTCDAFGVLPPVSKLSPEQAMYHFIAGYTAKVAGTEVGVKEPQATFSPCFGAPFMVWHPTQYAELLAKRLKNHNADVWLINTGWTGGKYGVGKRCPLKYTRAIIDAIHDGSLASAETATMPTFNLKYPKKVPGIPDEMLDPKATWDDKAEYDSQLNKLANLFNANFEQYADKASDAIVNAGPQL